MAENKIAPKKFNRADKVIAYYFHGNYRCASCTKLEKYSRDAISMYFNKEIKQGFLSFETVNTDLSENKHFLQDYQLYTKSLVLIAVKNNKTVKWKNLDKTWQHLNNKDDFYKYVQTETKKFLEGA
jgi:uncharacterized protein YacL (UPF0231 family)